MSIFSFKKKEEIKEKGINQNDLNNNVVKSEDENIFGDVKNINLNLYSETNIKKIVKSSIIKINKKENNAEKIVLMNDEKERLTNAGNAIKDKKILNSISLKESNDMLRGKTSSIERQIKLQSNLKNESLISLNTSNLEHNKSSRFITPTPSISQLETKMPEHEMLEQSSLKTDKPKLKSQEELQPQPQPQPQPQISPNQSFSISSNILNEVSNNFSSIMEFATTRPLTLANDLNCRYPSIKEKIYKLPSFALNEDLKHLISSNPYMKYLDLSDCTEIDDFSLIESLEGLEELDLSNTQFSNIKLLTKLTLLRVLNIGMTSVNDLTGFPICPNMQILNLKITEIKDISPIAHLTSLHDLILWGCDSIIDINVVKNFTELRVLDLDFCRFLKSIEPIKNLVKLIYLNLNSTFIENLSPISNLTNLMAFSMDFCRVAMSEQNLVFFENLKNMRFLDLQNRSIKNLHYFRNMTQLKELYLTGNMVTELDALVNLSEINTLKLSTNPSLVELSPLYKMTKMKKLIISGSSSIKMNITDISVVANMTKLNVIEMSFNRKIKDISILSNCLELEEAHFIDCLGLCDITPLRFCLRLRECHFDNCMQIKDLSFLKYCRDLQQATFSKTSMNLSNVSNWFGLLTLFNLRGDTGTKPIHAEVIDSVKMRRKINGLLNRIGKDEKIDT